MLANTITATALRSISIKVFVDFDCFIAVKLKKLLKSTKTLAVYKLLVMN